MRGWRNSFVCRTATDTGLDRGASAALTMRGDATLTFDVVWGTIQQSSLGSRFFLTALPKTKNTTIILALAFKHVMWSEFGEGVV